MTTQKTSNNPSPKYNLSQVQGRFEQSKLDAAMSKLSPQEKATITRHVNRRIERGVSEATVDERRALEAAEQKYKSGMVQVSGFLTKTESKLVLSCLHPDKQPSDKRRSDAFVLARRAFEGGTREG